MGLKVRWGGDLEHFKDFPHWGLHLRIIMLIERTKIGPILIGSKVFLNSGSPPLTVMAWTNEGITVAWWDDDEIQVGCFPPVCLSLWPS